MPEWQSTWNELPKGTKRAVATAIVAVGESLNEVRPGGLADPERSGSDLFARLVARTPDAATLLQNAKTLFELVPRGKVKDFLEVVREWEDTHDPHREEP